MRRIPEREAARAAGQSRYETGIPCKNGHTAPRLVSSGTCTRCRVANTIRWKKEHPGYEAKQAQVRRAKDPTKHRAGVAKWAKANPEKARVISKRCIDKNPELWRKRYVAYVQARKARVIANGGRFTPDDIDRLFRTQNGLCAACHEPKKLEVDHIIAVVNGGRNDPSNIQLLCGRCNKSKGRKDFNVWLAEQPHRKTPS